MLQKVYLSLGSNLGAREKYLSKAIREINATIGQLVVLSGIYETEAWGFKADEKFLNVVIEITTVYSASEVLEKCLGIESGLGRVRNSNKGYSSRNIDIDVLFYANEIVADATLTLPHPHLSKRRFILEPLNEIAPDFKHPVLGLTITELLKQCSDPGIVTPLGVLAAFD
ncbi:MAG: 2-amino-4-hydroxy-6-hydroxymethyldihydropteridine diphosphokinase [Prolixibacteraceae bacterium]